jgi:hypothetical protein
MCDYSLHAVASRPAQVGETLITTAFPRTSTRGFASESAPEIAVCLLPGTELAYADNVRYQSQWLWPKVIERALENSACLIRSDLSAITTRLNFPMAAGCS